LYVFICLAKIHLDDSTNTLHKTNDWKKLPTWLKGIFNLSAIQMKNSKTGESFLIKLFINGFLRMSLDTGGARASTKKHPIMMRRRLRTELMLHIGD